METINFIIGTSIFTATVLALCFFLSQSGKKKRTYQRDVKGKFSTCQQTCKVKRIVLVKEGNQIISYFAI